MERFHRQLGIFNPEIAKDRKITVIGAGSVGSFTVLTLAKLGFSNIKVYDFDSIEDANIPNQFYRLDDIGTMKVFALQEIVEIFTGVKIEPCNVPYIDQELEDIVIIAVDTMDTRLEIWEKIKYNVKIKQYIDARMGAEQMRIYCINPVSPVDCEIYESNLYPSDEADELPCSERSIIYNVLALASLIASLVKKTVTDSNPSMEIIFDLKTMGLISNDKETIYKAQEAIKMGNPI